MMLTARLGVPLAPATSSFTPQRLHERMPCEPSCSGRDVSLHVRCQAAPAIVQNGLALSNGAGYIRPHLRHMQPYTPILPFEVLSQQMGMDPHDIVKLDANENPYGPPAEVLQALGSMQFPNIYPDPETRRLRELLAQLNDIPMEHLLVSDVSQVCHNKPKWYAMGLFGNIHCWCRLVAVQMS